MEKYQFDMKKYHTGIMNRIIFFLKLYVCISIWYNNSKLICSKISIRHGNIRDQNWYKKHPIDDQFWYFFSV